MTKILLVAAEARELEGVLGHCRASRKLRWPLEFARLGEQDSRQLFLVAHGHGPSLAGAAADAAASREKFDAVLSIGFCGALNPGLAVGDIFVALRVDAPEQGASFTALAPRVDWPFASGCLLSLDRVVQTAEEKRRLRAAGAEAVEMEAAAVASRAANWDVPFFCVRVVIDGAEEDLRLDFNAARDASGRIGPGRVVMAALNRPWVLLPELYELYRRSRLAARVVGDFVARCRF